MLCQQLTHKQQDLLDMEQSTHKIRRDMAGQSQTLRQRE